MMGSDQGQSKTCLAFLWEGVRVLAAAVIFAVCYGNTKKSQPGIRAPLHEAQEQLRLSLAFLSSWGNHKASVLGVIHLKTVR